jgi:HK97 family phage prohead protease
MIRSAVARGLRMLRAPRQFDSPVRPIDQILAEMTRSTRRVSRDEALQVPAVQKARNMVCSIATLPLVQYNKAGEAIENPLLQQLDPDVANVVTIAQTLEDLLFEGIAWWRIVGFGWDMFPVSVKRIDPSRVSVLPPSGRMPSPLPSGVDPTGGVVWVDGKEVPGSEIIRFDSPNPAVLKAGARAIRRALTLDATANLYAEDPRPLDYFTPTEGAEEMPDEEIAGFLSSWRSYRKRRTTAYVPRAVKYNSVDTPSPQQLQLVELQRQAGLDISNSLGVDPEELGISTTSRTYANAVDRRKDRVNDTLSPYMKAMTDRLSMGDVTRRGHYVAFDLDDYMRADPKTRVEYYAGLKALGALDSDEVRAKEKLPPRAAPAAEPPAPVPPGDPGADDAQTEVEQSVDASRAASLQLNGTGTQSLHMIDVPMRQFTVDSRRRTIEGLALPYGVVGSKYGMKFRFLKGSLKWTSVNRVKMLRDHDPGQAIGVAASLADQANPPGLRVKLKVARGSDGDSALSLAEDGVLDGLSVGVEFDLSADTETDPNDPEVMLVRRADLREVSLTAMPLYDDARVDKVTASKVDAARNDNGGNTVEECATCGQRHAPGATCPPQNDGTNSNNGSNGNGGPAQGLALSTDQLTALLTRPGALQALAGVQQQTQQPAQPRPDGGLNLSAEQVDHLIRTGGLAVLLGLPQPQTGQGQPEPRQVVNPTHGPGPVKVSEPEPYRFDRKGNLTSAKFDFSTDVFNGFKGDAEALDRATRFMRTQFDKMMRVEGITGADVATLNPSEQRPDLYVDQKEFEYPIWSAIDKGAIDDATPFILPKFNSSSGLVGAHVENTEPTPGAFTATSQTITPSAVSGKVEIPRETWDQGGNPQLSGLIWRQMIRAWFEALEAAAVTLLEAAAPTTITITTAAADAALEASLTSQLAPLQFVRGGFRMRDAFTQVDLYKALVAAKDTNGRKLFPILGAQNATGTTSDLFAAVLVGGLAFKPAWALAATSINSSNSYLFDRADVSGWATPPMRLTFDNIAVAKVHVGIWGYKALAITDITGVRRLAYDPV